MTDKKSGIDQEQDKIVDEFSLFDDWMDRYDLLIEAGKNLPAIAADLKKNDYLINGCQSRVWLYPEYKDGKIYFSADSDAIITKGIAALLIRVLSGRTPDEIIGSDLYFIDKTGLRQNLSPTRSNGLLAMLKQIRLYAIALKAKQEK